MSFNVSEIAVRLGDALSRVRKDAGLNQTVLAELLDPLIPRDEEDDKPLSQTWVSRRESGRPEARPTEIAAWEQVSGARPGTVYQLAGLIDTSAVTRSVIANDSLLRPWQRGSLLFLYQEFLDANVRESDT